MINDLKKIYDEWNHQKLVLENLDDFIEITTPFVDMNHDYIQLFLTKTNDSFYITDDGYIISELEMLGIDIKGSKKRKDFFNTTLKIFGVNYNKNTDELYATFKNLNEFPDIQHRLLQCIIRVSDILLTSRNTVISIFTEEIANFFEENNVFYTDGISLIGTSGRPQNFDFVLPKGKNKKEKLIKAINTPNSDNYIDPLFSWIDIRNTRKNSEFMVLANDNNKMTDSFLTPLINYNVEVLEWSKRNEWVKQFQII